MHAQSRQAYITERLMGQAFFVICAVMFSSWSCAESAGPASATTWANADFHDSHLHLTNYVQEGTDIEDFISMMGARVGRSTVFGIPLQQQWLHSNTGDWAPTYYLQTDAPLYYYSFTDAHIAMAYRSLTKEQQARIDPEAGS